MVPLSQADQKLPKTIETPQLKSILGPFCYVVYGIWYVVYGMKMAFTVYSHMFRVYCAQAAYNIVHLFLVVYGIWYVVYGMKMAFTVYLHIFCMHHAQAVYNVVHIFLVIVLQLPVTLFQGQIYLATFLPDDSSTQ